MNSYLTYIYVCNHQGEFLIHVAHTISESFNFLSNLHPDITDDDILLSALESNNDGDNDSYNNSYDSSSNTNNSYDDKYDNNIFRSNNNSYDDKYNNNIIKSNNNSYNDKYNSDIIIKSNNNSYDDKHNDNIIKSSNNSYDDGYNDNIVEFSNSYNDGGCGNNIIKSIDNNSDKTYKIQVLQNILVNNKYLLFDLPSKYFDKMFKKKLDNYDYEKFRNCIHGSTFSILIIKTNDDGTFYKQLNDAVNSIC